jgi:hypothetical protein
MVAQGQTAAWHFDGSNTAPHTVTDASRMGLYNSGPRSPGGSFIHRFYAAGLYPFEDLTDSATGTIAVPVRIFPSSGGGSTSTTYRVTWASEPAASGFRFDIQILRPGGAAFEP